MKKLQFTKYKLQTINNKQVSCFVICNLLIVIFGLIFIPGRSLAQEDNVMSAASSLQDVLAELKQSVAQLQSENDQLTLRDKAVKSRVLQLQMQLGQIVAQGSVLNKTAAQLQDKNPRRSQTITRLEGENYALDNQTQKAEVAIKLLQQSLGAGYQEEQQLLLQLKGMNNGQSLPPWGQSPQVQSQDHSQKEKLKLMKMIYDSQERQEALHGSILAFQENTPLQPAAGALAHQQLLKEQIKDLEAQIAASEQEKPSEGVGIADQWDNDQLRQLEGELKVLERNYAQLKNLMEKMGKKALGPAMTVSDHVEGDKLQGSLDDLNRQGHGLMADLDDLRSQMVDLDKRKSHLETMIQQMQ